MIEDARLHFVKFETRQIEKCLDYVRDTLMMSKDLPEVRIVQLSVKIYEFSHMKWKLKFDKNSVKSPKIRQNHMYYVFDMISALHNLEISHFDIHNFLQKSRENNILNFLEHSVDITDTQCGHYNGNFLSRIFGKNFVKVRVY